MSGLVVGPVHTTFILACATSMFNRFVSRATRAWHELGYNEEHTTLGILQTQRLSSKRPISFFGGKLDLHQLRVLPAVRFI